MYVQREEATAKVRSGKGRGGQRQTGSKTKRDVSGGPPAFGAECRRDRYRCKGNLCSRAAGPGRESGAGVFDVHRRSGGDGQVAGELWHHDGSDGEHGGVLDSALRCAGTTRGKAVPGGRPWHEKRTGTAHGLARMPVDPVPAFGRTAARGLSAGRRGMRGAVIDAAPRGSGADDQPTYPAHAQSADADECADPSRDQRHHRVDGFGHRGCHRRRATRPAGAGEAAGSAYQSQRRDDSQIAGGQLAGGASIHTEAVAADVPALPGADRRLR